MELANGLVAECLQNEPAFCSVECPFNLDVRDFIGKVQQGRLSVAYKTFQYAVGFPGIVTALCGEPCKQVCAMKDSGGAISMQLLEKASVDFARNKDPEQYNMPPKDKKIAIIGAGISGLACALRLTTKKYNVTVFEKSDCIGGHLYKLLSPEIFIKDIERQFKYERYTLNFNTDISDIGNLEYDAFYVATGKGGNDLGAASGKDGVFMGGSLTGADTMYAIAQGLNTAAAIEKYVKTGIMTRLEGPSGTKLLREGLQIISCNIVLPASGNAFTKDEALAEAKRCLKCACNACIRYSPLMNYFRKFPKRIAEEVEVTIKPMTLDGNGTVATRLISTCNHCGLCKEVCPKNIDVGEFLLQSHRTMHDQGAMPWAFHEFYLRDMDFSNHEAALARLPRGYDKSRYVFFPGCQLGASDPQYVIKSYQFLIERFPDTALMLSCCGAPAHWAGDEAIHDKALAQIKTDFIKLGNPKAIFACSTCKQMFQRYLPEIESDFLYNIMAEKGIVPARKIKEKIVSVFDPCTSRYESDLHKTIREMAIGAGFHLEPLPMEGNLAQCCSYGGQVAITYPPYADNLVKTGIEQNNNPYITYCANCRDIFAAAGKQTWHILDILFDLGDENRVSPTVSERRYNRLRLKHQVIKEFWKETSIMKNPGKELFISQELKKKLNKELIIESDIYTVIENCEQSGRKLFDPEAGTFSGHIQIGNMTYWVEYRVKQDFGIELINAYGHRMKIEET
ncbi:MAG: FAD-dependent oxidoreductase [Bacteroidales bacterium]|nr:FAD-dependent oxidoreductase [Bacteroidales bacterium]